MQEQQKRYVMACMLFAIVLLSLWGIAVVGDFLLHSVPQAVLLCYIGYSFTLVFFNYWRVTIPELSEEQILESLDVQKLDEENRSANFSDAEEVQDVSERKKNKESKKNEKLKLFDEIKRVFDEDQVYLNPNYNLTDLSEHLQVPITSLSKAIKLGTQNNFYTFLNLYRLQHMLQLLSDNSNDQYTLETLSEQSGFKSRMTVHKYFKLIFDNSPSAIKSLLQNQTTTYSQLMQIIAKEAPYLK